DLPRMYPNEFPTGYDPAKYSDEENTRLAYNAYLKKFLRCVKGIDDNLGRLFAYLEQNDLMDNTLIVYTGDQGFMLGEHDYQDKRWMYDQSQRMPLLMRCPKHIPAGQRFDTIVENVDYGPTMLDFAGAKIPADVQGASFRDLLETGKEPTGWKNAAYYRYWMHMAHHDNPAHLGLRTKTHKLIYYYGCNYQGQYQTPPGWELYDLKNDPMETRNVYDAPENAGLVQRLKRQLADLRSKVGDDGGHYPECEKIVQQFWDYGPEDQRDAREISAQYLQRRQNELQKKQRNIRSWGSLK
ncbi:MAG: sulfatase/phosphatase domain-containing protein, partial [Planctomycetota bacterium]